MVKILIVENEMIIARDLQSTLNNLGYNVLAINNNGEEAVTNAGEMQPDLVLMDIKLDGKMDGIEVAKRIRDKYNIPSIYLTFYSDDVTLERAKCTEPLGYIIKPFTDNEIRAQIEIALYNYKIEKKLKRSNEKKCKLIKALCIKDQELYEKNKELINTQKKLQKISRDINNANSKVKQSIDYANKIQQSILPATKHLQKKFPQSFIYYKPKDVVSGDFPWYYDRGDDIYIAAVDCTGHGVPGAMLSFIGYFLLEEIAGHTEVLQPSIILDRLNIGVKKTLRQDKIGIEARDGMDIALCKINLKKMEVDFAGAYRPLYVVSEGKLIEYKGNRKPIGGIYHNNSGNFTNHSMKIRKGDSIFIFTDGMPDQFGGEMPEEDQYSIERIQRIIQNNQHLPMPVMAVKFDGDFEKWKGNTMQYDDVLMIGIRF